MKPHFAHSDQHLCCFLSRKLLDYMFQNCNLLGMGYVILLWHSLSFPYNYVVFAAQFSHENAQINKFIENSVLSIF